MRALTCLLTVPGIAIPASDRESLRHAREAAVVATAAVLRVQRRPVLREVYRARDTKLDRDVAVKVLPQALAESADALARFEREAKAVAALSHPNILAILRIHRQQGRRVVF